MTFRTIPKRLALRFLPDGVLHFVKKIHYARVLRGVNEGDESDFKVLKVLIEPGQFVADIGGNIGVYAKYLSERVGSSGRVISVEPIPSTFDILSSNLRKLGLSNAKAMNCAISDSEGQVTMHVPRYDSGGEDFYGARIGNAKVGSSVRTFVVPATTLDALLAAVPKIDFIKCDVEGHELNCIRGALKTIERTKPAWLIEISEDLDDRNSSSYQASRLLHDNGYDTYWFDGTKLRRRCPGTKSVNYFFLTAAQAERLRQKGIPFA